jgi:hypothetical protein
MHKHASMIIYYASQFDNNKNNLEGHLLIETKSEQQMSRTTMKLLFKSFVEMNNGFLFQIEDSSEKYIPL